MTDNVIPVVFCFDKRIILGASVALKSLFDSAKPSTIYDVRIFHSDIDVKNQKNITKLAKNTNHNISFNYINPQIFAHAPHNNKSWTEVVYYRLLAPEILKEYDKIIYSDVDVLFKGDLAEVYNLDIENYEMAAVPVELNKPEGMIGHNYFPENKNDKIYISSFILMNAKLMRENNAVARFFDVIRKMDKRLKFFDLDTMNIAIDKFYPLPYSCGVLQSLYYGDDFTQAREYEYIKNVQTDEQLKQAKENPILIHYAGKAGKPWRMKKPYPDYKQFMDKLPKELKQTTLRDIRKKLFNKR